MTDPDNDYISSLKSAISELQSKLDDLTTNHVPFVESKLSERSLSITRPREFNISRGISEVGNGVHCS